MFKAQKASYNKVVYGHRFDRNWTEVKIVAEISVLDSFCEARWSAAEPNVDRIST